MLSTACPCAGRRCCSRRWTTDLRGRNVILRMPEDGCRRARKRSATVFMSARRDNAHCALAHTRRSRAKRRTCRLKHRFHHRWILTTCSRSCCISSMTGRPRVAANRKDLICSAADVCSLRRFFTTKRSRTTATRKTSIRCFELRRPHKLAAFLSPFVKPLVRLGASSSRADAPPPVRARPRGAGESSWRAASIPI